MDLQEFKKNIDNYLYEFLDSKIKSLPLDNNQELISIFNQLLELSKEGKRIRPYIAYLSYKASGGNDDKKAIKLFTFIEIFHLFCLVHDDIMDKAEKRHNVKTIHKFISENNNEHYGNSQATLAGDLLLAWSFEFLLNSDFSYSQINEVQQIFSQMIDEVCLGQMLDLNITTKDKISNDEIMQKMLLKTAGYTFAKPLLIGASLTGKKDDEFYINLGRYMGIAFQIQDDLIDIDMDNSNKSSFNDISEHQHTLFTNYVFENGNDSQKKILNELFGKTLTGIDKKKLKIVFNESGAINYGKEIINFNIEQAKNLIITKTNSNYDVFIILIDLINNRKY